MPRTSPRILLLTADPDLAGDVSEALDESFGATIAVVDSVEDARQFEIISDFHLVIADAACAGPELADFIRNATAQSIPTLLVDDDLIAQRVLDALRLGAIDVLVRPLDFQRLEDVIRATLDSREQARRAAQRQRRLRLLSSRMIRDRRELRQRIDLLCKDLVGAYRRLAEKVVAAEAGSLSADRASSGRASFPHRPSDPQI